MRLLHVQLVQFLFLLAGIGIIFICIFCSDRTSNLVNNLISTTPQKVILQRYVGPVLCRKIYVFNGIDPARRPRLEKEFEASFVPSDMLEWLTWPNKPDLTEKLIIEITGSSEPTLGKGAVCCIYKHYLALQDMILQNYDYAVIMEDNVTFDPEVNILERIEQYIRELNRDYPDWDVLFDSSYLPVTEHMIESDKFVYTKSLMAQPGCDGASRLAQFYVIRKKAARALVSKYLPSSKNPDHLMNDLFRLLGMQVFWSHPPMVSYEKNHFSTQ